MDIKFEWCEEQPAIHHGPGHLDLVFSIFKARNHPIILVEESAFRWMGVRVSPIEDLDLLVRDSDMVSITADLLATGQYKLSKQNLDLRHSDTYTQQVPRLRGGRSPYYSCISLWSESVYKLAVDGAKVEVPDPQAWNVVLMEERFDVDPSWAQATSISYTSRLAGDVQVLPPRQAQSPGNHYPVYVPTIPRMLDALNDQGQSQLEYLKEFPERASRVMNHLKNFVRYLHLDTTQQQQKVLDEVAERNRVLMERIIAHSKRKPLISLDSLRIVYD